MERLLAIAFVVFPMVVYHPAFADDNCDAPGQFDLKTCPNPTQSPTYDKKAHVNGCGLPVIGVFIPDTFGGVPFTPWCNAHDECYGTCNPGKSGKESCDKKFLKDMIEACVHQASGDLNKGDMYWCVQGARFFYGSVKKFSAAQTAYSVSQRDACQCCWTTKIWCECKKTCWSNASSCASNCRGSLLCFAQSNCGPATPEQCPPP